MELSDDLECFAQELLFFAYCLMARRYEGCHRRQAEQGALVSTVALRIEALAEALAVFKCQWLELSEPGQFTVRGGVIDVAVPEMRYVDGRVGALDQAQRGADGDLAGFESAV